MLYFNNLHSDRYLDKDKLVKLCIVWHVKKQHELLP